MQAVQKPTAQSCPRPRLVDVQQGRVARNKQIRAPDERRNESRKVVAREAIRCLSEVVVPRVEVTPVREIDEDRARLAGIELLALPTDRRDQTLDIRHQAGPAP
jgi:hypothetical protein